ncbi:ABC transporter substrate-binding protein [Dichotomicrobium thermohalophilum]|uniref:Amino acid/amide ABC transporter substrate-binding protein (HAAT family) n=1 Tax=Dichotomicrobium thermohalophilum TaxID=933063 RepID=A0A397P8J5_9HYPH|nr:ABC transporter substrate-binding protein [Dichotomicrobium thermohalophilum]RIA45412.1 amino acid/amide ABC transporter substrate-binding protein (HAAT family) [Dichotomicrobium thermohalophilum]
MHKHLTKFASAIAVAASLAAGSSVHAQEEPIKIGAIYIFSGVAATYGEFAQRGADLAVEEINASGGVLGRPLEITYEDSQIKAQTAIQAMRKLVYQEEVDVLMGLDSSGVATGVVPIVPEVQTPFIITHAATPDVTGKLCNEWTYRVSVNINQNVKGAATMAAETDAQTWTTVGPDYAFGRQSWDFFQQYLGELNPDAEFSDSPSFPAFGTEDFTPFINAVIDAQPDGVFVSLWGGDLVNFIRQASDLGFFEQDFEVIMSLGAATEVLSALGDQMPEGVTVGTRYWYAGPDNPTNDAFVKAYRERHGTPPSYNAQNAYAAVYAYKNAIETAGEVDKAAIRDALSGMTFQAPIGEVTFREGDHQAVVGPAYGVTRDDPDSEIAMLEPLRLLAGEDVTPAVEDTGCNLAQ